MCWHLRLRDVLTFLQDHYLHFHSGCVKKEAHTLKSRFLLFLIYFLIFWVFVFTLPYWKGKSTAWLMHKFAYTLFLLLIFRIFQISTWAGRVRLLAYTKLSEHCVDMMSTVTIVCCSHAWYRCTSYWCGRSEMSGTATESTSSVKTAKSRRCTSWCVVRVKTATSGWRSCRRPSKTARRKVRKDSAPCVSVFHVMLGMNPFAAEFKARDPPCALRAFLLDISTQLLLKTIMKKICLEILFKQSVWKLSSVW